MIFKNYGEKLSLFILPHPPTKKKTKGFVFKYDVYMYLNTMFKYDVYNNLHEKKCSGILPSVNTTVELHHVYSNETLGEKA